MWRRLDSFLVRPRRKKFRAGFVVGKMEMGIYFWSVPFPPPLLSPSLHVREIPEFLSLMSLDRSGWHRFSLAWLVTWS